MDEGGLLSTLVFPYCGEWIEEQSPYPKDVREHRALVQSYQDWLATQGSASAR